MAETDRAGRMDGGMHRWVKGVFVLIAVALGGSDLHGQEVAAPPVEGADGFRIIYGPTAARPILDDVSGAVFEGLGDGFQTGLGIRVGAGYQLMGVELIATAEYAGVDVGDPFERDGISMGRRSSILRGYTATLWWSPAAFAVGSWRGRVGGGFLAGGLDNVSMTPDQLSGDFLELARTIEEGEDAHPTGVSGSGFRIGAGVERDFGRTLAAQIHLEADRMSYDEFIYGSSRFDYDAGSAWIPRLAAVLRWAP